MLADEQREAFLQREPPSGAVGEEVTDRDGSCTDQREVRAHAVPELVCDGIDVVGERRVVDRIEIDRLQLSLPSEQYGPFLFGPPPQLFAPPLLREGLLGRDRRRHLARREVGELWCAVRVAVDVTDLDVADR